jgi:hypothetical protein
MRIILLILLSAATIQGRAQQGTYFDLLKSEISKERATLIRKAMPLKEREAKLFWPIYAEYEKELNELRSRQFSLIKEYIDNYDDLSEKKTFELLKNSLESQQGRVDLDKKYYELLTTEINPKTAVRFFQVNDQIELMLRLQIWSQLPLVKK